MPGADPSPSPTPERHARCGACSGVGHANPNPNPHPHPNPNQCLTIIDNYYLNAKRQKYAGNGAGMVRIYAP